MSDIRNEHQAIDETAVLLSREKYRILDEVNNISRILVAQMFIFKLYLMIKKDSITAKRKEIGHGVGVGEKAIRDWQFGDDCPTLEHLISLAKYYKQMRGDV
jgi:hypothetical protein